MKKEIKILNLMIIAFSLVMLNSCDFCTDGGTTSGFVEGDIYFTGTPVNGYVPSIFRINSDGTNLREVYKNAWIYSAPSYDKKIVMTGEAGTKRIILMSNIDGSKARWILNEAFAADKLYPLMSPHGRYFIVTDVRNGLWIVKNEKDATLITGQLTPNTLPAFSPDGTKLAYYDGFEIFRSLSLKILDLESDPPKVIYTRKHNQGLNPWKGDATIDWMNDNKTIAYVTTISETADQINVVNYVTDDEISYEVTSFGAFMPALSQDGERIAFAARDGNIMMRNLKDTIKKYINLTGTGKIGYSLYPKWSKDGKSILYTKFYKDDFNLLHGSLEMIEFEGELPILKVLNTNVNKGFWNIIGKITN